MCNVPIQLNEDVIAAYLNKYGSVEEDVPVSVTDYVVETNNRLVRVGLRLVDTPSRAGNWKFNTWDTGLPRSAAIPSWASISGGGYWE